ncbi:methyl-accepting chemotaxis protein [Janthinobacterium psychrotolerans]|uniref:Methyl-accepting chemotaxis protein n=1 Tax=Janthinobacterium psychrotolerans TaxID=1747903 RepID=A0A1A7BWS7_9BURK|nr:methyl-accepting chemotaxis protein [Janthinobacterium psychrotolerans]OBV37194.1 methyl-accepting chemotaxis protein [Janthinobacterium psychrotolerans]
MFSSLKTRLIAICIVIVMLAMLVITFTNFITTRSSTMASLNAQMLQLSALHAKAITDWVRGKSQVVSSLKLAADLADPIPFIQSAHVAGQFDDTYIGYPDKRMLALHPMPDGYDPTQRNWYQQALKSEAPILTTPYMSTSPAKLVVTFAAAFGPKGAATAVGAADIEIENVVASVVAIKPTASSFAFLVDGAGTIIAHPDKKLTLKPVADFDASLSGASLARSAATQEAAAVHLLGRDGLLYASKVPGTDWLLVIVLDRAEATAALTSMLGNSAVMALLVTLAAGAVLALLVAKALRRLALVRDALDDIASGDGDMRKRLNTDGGDELAQIARAFNRFVDKISTVLHSIRDTSNAVQLSSAEIASGNADLSARTESQAGSLEQTSSSMEELTATVRQNAANAVQASELALSASGVASQGGSVFSQVVSTMGSIKQSSNRITDIIGVIDGIAFQTNILALNAAVEAARAGEQGRGFAVVASEVRNLAQRSASAAREIKTLIVDSGAEIDSGERLVNQAGNTIGNIVDAIQGLAELMRDITRASQEQSQGIEEVNRAISHMDDITQQNSALVEESAAATESLKQMAQHLCEVVGGFKLAEPPASPATLARKALR